MHVIEVRHGPPKLADQERTWFTGKNRTLAPPLQRQTVLRTPFKGSLAWARMIIWFGDETTGSSDAEE